MERLHVVVVMLCCMLARRAVQLVVAGVAVAALAGESMAVAQVAPGSGPGDETAHLDTRSEKKPKKKPKKLRVIAHSSESEVVAGHLFKVSGSVKGIPRSAKRKGKKWVVAIKSLPAGATSWSVTEKSRVSAKRPRVSVAVEMPAVDTSFKACIKTRCSSPFTIRVLPPPPPPPPPPPSGNIDYSWTRVAADGYSFTAAVRDLYVTEVRYNTADQPVGEAKVYWSVSGWGTVTNTTPGRNAGPDWLQVAPAYPSSSAFCQYAKVSNSLGYRSVPRLEVSTSDYDGTNALFASHEDTEFCVGNAIRGSGVGTLPPGSTGRQDFDADGTRFSAKVPESVYETVRAELERPTFWILQRGSESLGVQHPFQLGACYSFSAVVATSPEGFSVCAQGVQ